MLAKLVFAEELTWDSNPDHPLGGLLVLSANGAQHRQSILLVLQYVVKPWELFLPLRIVAITMLSLL